jgi:hypothetical protein
MKELSRYKAIPLIRETKGRLFSCRFTKKDNSVRDMVCLVPPPKKDAKRASPAKENNSYILVRDIVQYKRVLALSGNKEDALKESYRLINLATLKRLTINGIHYTITD